MDKPTIVEKKPIQVTLEAGTKRWCSCGKSENQPWCDGKHKGSSFTPIAITVDESKEAFMCLCKQSRTGYCDGSHSKLPK